MANIKVIWGFVTLFGLFAAGAIIGLHLTKFHKDNPDTFAWLAAIASGMTGVALLFSLGVYAFNEAGWKLDKEKCRDLLNRSTSPKSRYPPQTGQVPSGSYMY